jgi:hypothetical protein
MTAEDNPRRATARQVITPARTGGTRGITMIGKEDVIAGVMTAGVGVETIASGTGRRRGITIESDMRIQSRKKLVKM